MTSFVNFCTTLHLSTHNLTKFPNGEGECTSFPGHRRIVTPFINSWIHITQHKRIIKRILMCIKVSLLKLTTLSSLDKLLSIVFFFIRQIPDPSKKVEDPNLVLKEVGLLMTYGYPFTRMRMSIAIFCCDKGGGSPYVILLWMVDVDWGEGDSH